MLGSARSSGLLGADRAVDHAWHTIKKRSPKAPLKLQANLCSASEDELERELQLARVA